MNNPDLYHIESPHENRSHSHEMPKTQINNNMQTHNNADKGGKTAVERYSFLESIKADKATIDRCNEVSKNAAKNMNTHSGKKGGLDNGGRERGDTGPMSHGRESGNKAAPLRLLTLLRARPFIERSGRIGTFLRRSGIFFRTQLRRFGERADTVRAVKAAAEDMDLPADPADMEGTDMIKHTLEGLSILPSPPQLQGGLRAPVVRLNDGLILDDSVFECPTLIMGPVGSGKTYMMEEIMMPILRTAEEMNENVFIFCAKKDLLKFKRPQDIVISVDATAPEACWNIFKELASSKNPELTARDIAKSLTKDQRSDLQPFFENSCNDLVHNAIMAVFEDGMNKGVMPTNRDLYDCLSASLDRDADFSWYTLAETKPERFAHIHDYLGNDLAQGYGIVSEIRTLLHDCFWGSFLFRQSGILGYRHS